VVRPGDGAGRARREGAWPGDTGTCGRVAVPPFIAFRGSGHERHAAHHFHCRICGEAGRRCEHACLALLDAL